jgi:hypothetical protein
MVLYCERATGFCKEVAHEDAGYFDALVRMFEQALEPQTRWQATSRTSFSAG